MRAALAIMLMASPATAQIVTPLNPGSIDTSSLATKADVQAVTSVASAAQAAALSACAPSAAVPPMELVGGAAGSGTACRLANAVQPRISRSVGFTTDATGQAVVTWQDMGAVPKTYVQENVATGATNIPKCYPVTGTITATGVTISCYVTQTLLGLGLLPFAKATAGVTGQVLALPAS